VAPWSSQRWRAADVAGLQACPQRSYKPLVVIIRNAAALATAPRVEHREVRSLSPDEVRRFLAAIKGDRDEALYTVAVATGLRQGELLGLRWPDVDLRAGSLTVHYALQRVGGTLQLVETKTARSRRTVPGRRVGLAADQRPPDGGRLPNGLAPGDRPSSRGHGAAGALADQPHHEHLLACHPVPGARGGGPDERDSHKLGTG